MIEYFYVFKNYVQNFRLASFLTKKIWLTVKKKKKKHFLMNYKCFNTLKNEYTYTGNL